MLASLGNDIEKENISKPNESRVYSFLKQMSSCVMKIHIPSKGLWMTVSVCILLTMLIKSIFPTNTDVFYIIGQGRDILENGITGNIYSFNWFSVPVVIQNYGWCVLLALAYDALGNFGLAIIQIPLLIGVGLVASKIILIKGYSGPIYKSFPAALICCSIAYVSMRPQLITLLLVLLQIYIIEYVRKTSKIKLLWLIVPLISIEMQVHMSMWPIHLIVVLPYVFPVEFSFGDGFKMKFRPALKGKATGISVFITSIAALFANPYGLDGVTYVLKATFLLDDYNINELVLTDFLSSTGLAIVLLIIGFVLYRAELTASDIYMTLGLIVLGTMARRNINFLPIAFICLVPVLLKKAEKNSLYVLVFALMFILFTKANIPVYVSNECFSPYYNELEGLLEYMPEKDAKIYADRFPDGGYLEYMGYNSNIFMSSRAEVYDIAMNHTADIGKAFRTIKDAKHGTKELIDEYKFDYMITGSDSALRELLDDSSDYKAIYEDTEYSKILFKRVKTDG